MASEFKAGQQVLIRLTGNPSDSSKKRFWNSTRAIFMERKAAEPLRSKAISESLTQWMGRKTYLYSVRHGGQLKINGEVTQVRSQGEPANDLPHWIFPLKWRRARKHLTTFARTGRVVKVFDAPVLLLAEIAATSAWLEHREETSGGKVVDYGGGDWTMHSKGVIAGSSEMIDAYLPYFR